MGYRVEAYSLEELHRISAPGAVVPSLFWMLPVGHWRMGELDECWRMFSMSGGFGIGKGSLEVSQMAKRRLKEQISSGISSISSPMRRGR